MALEKLLLAGATQPVVLHPIPADGSALATEGRGTRWVSFIPGVRAASSRPLALLKREARPTSGQAVDRMGNPKVSWKGVEQLAARRDEK